MYQLIEAFHAQIRGEQLISNLHLYEHVIFSLNVIQFVQKNIFSQLAFCRLLIIEVDLEHLINFFEIVQYILKSISVLRNTWNTEYNITLWTFVQTIVIPLVVRNAIKYMSTILERHIQCLPFSGEHLFYFVSLIVQIAFKFFLLPKIKKYFDCLGQSLPTNNNGAITI
jgi:hypothetical protein